MIHTLSAPSHDYHQPADGDRQPADPGDPGTGDTLRHLTFVTLGVGVVLTTFLAVAGLIFGDFGEGLGKAIGSSMARLVRGLISATNVFIAFAAFLLSVFTLAIEDVGADFLTLVASVFLIDLMLNVLVPIARHASPATDYRVDAATPVPARRQGAGPDYGIEASRSRAVP